MKIRSFITATLTAAALSVSAFAQKATFSTEQVNALHKIIYNYIVNNPQVLVDASNRLRQQAQQKQESAAITAIKANKTALFNDKASPVAGNPNGSVILVEFFDYQCGHCKAMEPIVESLMASDKNLKVIYKELPIFGGVSQFASEAALAANEQGHYQAFHQALMKAEPPLTQDKVMAIAKKAGLNVDKLKKAMKSDKITQDIKSNFALAQKLQLVGTPAFVLTNQSETAFKFIPGAIGQSGLANAIASVSASS